MNNANTSETNVPRLGAGVGAFARAVGTTTADTGADTRAAPGPVGAEVVCTVVVTTVACPTACDVCDAERAMDAFAFALTFDAAVDDAADVVPSEFVDVAPAVPVPAECVDVCVVPEAESCEACLPGRPEAPVLALDVAAADSAAAEFVAKDVVEEDVVEVASAAAELAELPVDAVVWVPAVTGPAVDEVVSFLVDAVEPPAPPDAPVSPEAPVLAGWEVDESPVSACAAPAPVSMAAPTPTLNAPALNQADTGNTRPAALRTEEVLVHPVSMRCRPAMGDAPSHSLVQPRGTCRPTDPAPPPDARDRSRPSTTDAVLVNSGCVLGVVAVC